MKVVFSPRSVRQLRDIQAFIAHDSPNAAVKVVARIRQSIEMLADYPRLAPVYEDGPEHVLTVSGLPYRIFYRVIEATDTVEIMLVLHTSRKPPER